MKTVPVPFLCALRSTCPALTMLVGLALCSGVGAQNLPSKPQPAAPAPLRLSNPQERALLIERINAALENTNKKYAKPRPARRGAKDKNEPRYTIPALAVEFGAPSPSDSTSKRTLRKRPVAAQRVLAAATAVTAATVTTSAIATVLQGGNDRLHHPPPAPVPVVVAPATVASLLPPPLSATTVSSLSRQYLAGRAATLAQTQPQQPSFAWTDPAAVPWSYDGPTGPQVWGMLHPSFAVCANGQRQSPIALDKPEEKPGPTADLPLGNQVFTGVLEHTGRFLELAVQGLSTLNLRGMDWELQRVQMHYPVEERIGNAAGAVMAVDLLYRAPTSQWAVVSVPLQLGTPNPFLAQLWNYLPLHSGERTLLTPGKLQVHDLLPADKRYYQYLGSFTTPPCTEGVLRLVLKTPGTVAPEQLQRLMALLPPHARPPQPLYGRQVLVGP